MPTETKRCRTCGDEFQSPLRPGGLSSSTVNCPSCRAKKRGGSGPATAAPARAKLAYCNECGQRLTSYREYGEHRRATGHRGYSSTPPSSTR